MKVPPTTVPAPQDEAAAEGPGIVLSFDGFDPPESNFWRLPNNWFDIVACFTSWAEHKVVEYILRHTWGYHEYDVCKLITMDEFMHGRKRRDGSRLDAGCGMAENSIKKGIADAVMHGFLIVEVDDSDRGRIKKFYGPRMRRPQRDEGTHAVRPLSEPPAPDARRDRPGGATGTRDATAQLQMRVPVMPDADAQTRESQLMQVQGQSLTPERQPLRAEASRLTPTGQSLTPHQHPLILSAATADPPTEKEPLVQHLRKTTRRQHTRVAAVSTVPEAHDLDRSSDGAPRAQALEVDLLHRLTQEGIAPARARALVSTYPAERIVRQLAWIDARSYQNRQATLIAAIERDYAAPVSRRPSVPAAGDGFDAAKFYRGTYAVCPQCGSRPCSCDAPRALGAARR
jgi:hypothetical protein